LVRKESETSHLTPLSPVDEDEFERLAGHPSATAGRRLSPGSTVELINEGLAIGVGLGLSTIETTTGPALLTQVSLSRSFRHAVMQRYKKLVMAMFTKRVINELDGYV
jgi:hypothetical protein